MKSSKNNAITLIQEQGEVLYYNNFLLKEETTSLYHKMQKNIEWSQYPITIFGKTMLQPRLIAWYGDKGLQYRYSNTTLIAKGWSMELLSLKEKIKTAFNLEFNSVLLNLYRDGQDSMGWHSDDEKELGNSPVIASISLGAERPLQFRHKKDKTKKAAIPLASGSLLLMKGDTQTHWQHQIPKSKKITQPRINLTFRTII